MSDESSDEIQGWLDGVKQGDQQALAALFSQHRERLRRMIDFRLDARLRGRVSTSDVLQEAYIDALKRLPHFQADPDVPFFIWLRTVTIQRLIQVHRQHLLAQGRDAGREVKFGRGDAIEASTDRMAELIGDLTSPSQAAHRGEAMERLREALERLDPTDREVLALRHFEEFSNLEVAALLGIQTSAASKRYVRALERLKNALEQSPGFGGEDRLVNDQTEPVEDDSTTQSISLSGSDPFDEVAEDFAARCRRGESPSIGEYEGRYPEFATKIRKLLPTVALMEQIKRGMSPPGGGELTRAVPERLGEFRVLRELGRGGMGVVYEAVQESLGRHVALKVIHHVHLDAKRLLRFQREAQAVAQLHHTNIVPIFGVGEHEGLPYYVMQYIQGRGLDALLTTWRRADDECPDDDSRRRIAAHLGAQAAEALQYAHEQGIIHRDIKPANLLVDEHDTVWITDFGLAKLTGHDDLTASGDVIGTLRYLAPEVLQGESDARSDVYSLGLTLYELLTLKPPFGDVSASELLRQVSESQPARPRGLDPDMPRDLETIVLKAIAREPSQRYATAGALADDLRRFLEDRPIRARRATLFERGWRWSRRNRATAALALAAIGSLFLATVVGWAGYVSTGRALKRADENVALSLAVFEELFERLAPHDSLAPPPLGRSARETGPGPDRGPGPGRGPGAGPPPLGPYGRRPPPPRPEDDPFGPPPAHPGGPGGPGRPFGPPDRPGGGPFGPERIGRRSETPEKDTALLTSVLTFYDRFARQNATNPRLQGEAASACRKVGALLERMGRDAEAEASYTRAIAMFEELVTRFPKDLVYRSRLVDTYDMVDPWSAEPSALPRLEQRFRRARTLSDQLVAESPGNSEYALSRVHLHAKFAVVLQRLKRDDEADAAYRRAIVVETEALALWPRDSRLLIDRSITREALALLQIERGRRDEAKTLVDGAAADLETAMTSESMGGPPADRFESLAEVYESLGDTERADEMDALATESEALRRPGPPGPPRPPGPPGPPRHGPGPPRGFEDVP